jgi:hypothetical protein
MNINRIKKLAGLTEAFSDEDEEREYKLENEKYDREQRIKKLIAFACKRIGMSYQEDGGIIYNDDDREAVITLDDFSVNLDLLIELKKIWFVTKI